MSAAGGANAASSRNSSCNRSGMARRATTRVGSSRAYLSRSPVDFREGRRASDGLVRFGCNGYLFYFYFFMIVISILFEFFVLSFISLFFIVSYEDSWRFDICSFMNSS